MPNMKKIASFFKRPAVIFVSSAIVVIFLFFIEFLPESRSHLSSNSKEIDPEVSELIRDLPSSESYPDADIIYILDEAVIEIFDDCSSKETVHVVFKIVSEFGKEYADCEIDYNSLEDDVDLLHARTINPDGEIIPLRNNAIQVTTSFSDFPKYSDYAHLSFSLPGVEVGSIIDYKYVKEAGTTIEDVFTDRFSFQSCQPALLSRYKIIAPEDVTLNYLFLNPMDNIKTSPAIISEAGKKTYLWEFRDVPQILYEDFMPPLEEVAPNILVTTMGSWETFFSWWQKVVKNKTEPDDAIKQKTLELTKNLSSVSEKIQALYDYVKRDIRYVSLGFGKSGYIPESARDVFINKYGDCKDKSTLLISMLKAAGIPAHYVLIPTFGERDLITDFAFPFQFNHCIVAVENGEGYYYLDSTEENYPFDFLPEYDQYRCVLIFKENKAIFAKTPLFESKENTHLTRHKVRIKPDGSAQTELKYNWSGTGEATLRSLFIDFSPTEVEEFLEEYVYDNSPGARLLDYDYSDPLDFKKRFETTIEYNETDACEKAGDLLILHIPMEKEGCTAAEKKERRYPILFHSLSCYKNEVEFNIPEGYEIYDLQEKVSLSNPYFDYHSSFQTQSNILSYKEEFNNKVAQIPVENYADYRKSCQKVENSQQRILVFKKKS